MSDGPANFLNGLSGVSATNTRLSFLTGAVVAGVLWVVLVERGELDCSGVVCRTTDAYEPMAGSEGPAAFGAALGEAGGKWSSEVL